MRKKWIVLVGVVFFGFAFTNVWAVGPKSSWLKGACKDDVQKFCKDVKVGEWRVVDCLQGHEAELSPGCRQLNDKLVKRKAKQAAKTQKKANANKPK